MSHMRGPNDLVEGKMRLQVVVEIKAVAVRANSKYPPLAPAHVPHHNGAEAFCSTSFPLHPSRRR